MKDASAMPLRARLVLLSTLLASHFLVGCANEVYSFSYTPITKQYSKQLDSLNLGMTKSEVRNIIPDLILRGQTSVDGQSIEALELQHNYWAGVGGRLINDRLWFYFANGRLVKWGQPNDWPQKPDLIIERR